MPISSLDHINIVTADLQRSVSFYVEVLGLREGERPPFDFPGAWLYAGDDPIVHLIAVETQSARDTGPIDHVALKGRDIVGLRKRLDESGIAFDERRVPGSDTQQVFVHDPDGVKVEINFLNES